MLAIALVGCAKDPIPQPTAPPNVVVVVGCTLRADQTTPYGGPGGTTPFLADLAEDGVRFADTIAQGPWTKPGSTAILTGRYPMTIGMVNPDPGRDDRVLAPAVVTLAERLHDAGWRTIGVSANPNVGSAFGFEQGMDVFVDASPLWREGMVKVDGGTVVREALARVDAVPRDRPLYLQLLLVDAHLPADLGRWEELWYGRGAPTPRVAKYRAMLRRFDGYLEDLVDGLDERGVTRENTLLVVAGDHGEGLSMPQHHGNGHGHYLYDTALHVPWVMRGPGLAQDHVVSGMSAQVDLVPTVLGVLGLPADSRAPGFDWSRQARGEADRTDRDAVYADTWFHASNRAALYLDRWACMKDYGSSAPATPREERKPPFREGCFDRDADPAMRRPIRDPERMAALEARRARLEIEMSEWTETTDATPDAETVRQLEALGYVE